MMQALLKTETLSNISRDIGQVFFAALFIGQLIQPVGKITVIILGLVLSLFFWLVNVLLAKE